MLSGRAGVCHFVPSTELISPHMRTFQRPYLSNPISKRFQRRGYMSMSRYSAALVLSLTVSAAFPQSARPNSVLAAGGAPTEEAKEPKLEHFDPNLVDKTLDPCNDFYKYACRRWLTANPIPADQVDRKSVV